MLQVKYNVVGPFHLMGVLFALLEKSKHPVEQSSDPSVLEGDIAQCIRMEYQ